jgi:hypothetical protein
MRSCDMGRRVWVPLAVAWFAAVGWTACAADSGDQASSAREPDPNGDYRDKTDGAGGPTGGDADPPDSDPGHAGSDAGPAGSDAGMDGDAQRDSRTEQTVSFTSTAPTGAAYQSATYAVTASASSGLSVQLTIDATATSVCSIAGSTVSFIGTGTCVVNADQPGNATYDAAARVQQTFAVGPRLVAESYGVVGNTQLVAAGHSAPTTPFTSDATSLLANDSADEAITVTAVSSGATTGGGSITIDTSGKFTYTPPVGVSWATDTYVYTGTSHGVSRTATITFWISDLVWYINSASTGAHDGRSSSPFLGLGPGANNLGESAAPGATIYVHKGAATTPGAHTLLANQRLIGAGATLSMGALTIWGYAPAPPTLTGTLAASNVAGVVVDGVRMSTGTSTAINFTNTDGTFKFTSISADGASNGIVWNNATAALPSSSLTVTGSGFDTSLGGDGSGGTLSNMVGPDGAISGNAIYLNNVGNVTLRRMFLGGAQNYGIRGFNVTSFTLEYSTLSGVFGDAASLAAPETAGEGAIYFGNTSTSGILREATFTKNFIAGGRARNVSITKTYTAAASASLTFRGNTLGLNQNFADASESLAIEALGTGTSINAILGGSPLEANTFYGAPGHVINVTGGAGTMVDLQMRYNSISNIHASNTVGRGGVELATAGTLNFMVDQNRLWGADGNAITLTKASTGARLYGYVAQNLIGVTGVAGSGSKSASGIRLAAAGTGTVTLNVYDNELRNWAYAGMDFDNAGGSYTANFTIQHNTVAEPGAAAFASLYLRNGAPGTLSDTVDVCAAIGGAAAHEKNTFDGAATTRGDVYVAAGGAGSGHTFNLPGYVGSSLADVQAFLALKNTVTGTTAYNAVAHAPAGADDFTGTGMSCPP